MQFHWPQSLAVLVLALVLLTAVNGNDSNKEVTIGSVIKLRHEKLKVYLHSHEVAYGSGSGQQSVTGFNGGDDSNDYWVVKCPHKKPTCRQGMPVADGDSVRLQHMVTRKWLHSHMHSSPLSGNFEVSGYGSDTQSDTGDHWRVEVESASTWRRDGKVRFLHEDVQSYLLCHNMQYGRPIAGQYEVCGSQKKSAESFWTATEGVYLPVRKYT